MDISHKNFILKLLTLGALAFVLASCATARPTVKEHLDWDIGDYVLVFEEKTGWKGVGGEETYNRIYSTPGATAENWTVTLNVVEFPIAVTFMSKTRWNPESIMNTEKNNLAKNRCTDPWTVMQSDSESLLYERTEVECPGYLHQYEVGRIVMGEWYSWWLRYRIRDKVLSADEKNALIVNLKKAKVVK